MTNIYVTTCYRLEPQQIEKVKELIQESLKNTFCNSPTNLVYSQTMGNTEEYELCKVAESCDAAIFLGDCSNISQNFFFDYEKDLFKKLGKNIYYTDFI